MKLYHGSNLEVRNPKLLPQKLKDQYTFKTPRAIALLVWEEVIVL